MDIWEAARRGDLDAVMAALADGADTDDIDEVYPLKLQSLCLIFSAPFLMYNIFVY